MSVIDEHKQALEALVDRILAAKQADPSADVESLETQIDHLVYQLYNLTPEEITIVEGGVTTKHGVCGRRARYHK